MKAIASFVLLLLGCVVSASQPREHAFDCQGPFAPDTSVARLEQEFGRENVEPGQIELGEGQFEDGTVVFPRDPKKRVDIVWKDKQARKSPDWIRIGGSESSWRTPEGITLSTDLLTLEKLNRKPFRLAGFDWDYGGTVLSWSNGALDRRDAPCRLLIRVHPGPEARTDKRLSRLKGQVTGDREFSSGHPAMQALNPRVYEVRLIYKDWGYRSSLASACQLGESIFP